jgi:ABC-2 type transport system ATP-binding protein
MAAAPAAICFRQPYGSLADTVEHRQPLPRSKLCTAHRYLPSFATVSATVHDLPLAQATTAASTAVLRCTDLHKRFEDLVAVDGVTFEIAPGESYGLLGPNGAGKTTTISILCGLLACDAGTVEVAGRAMTTRSVAAKAVLGYVPQELAIYLDMTARENMRFFARLYNLRGRAANARIEEVLEIIGLSERADDLTQEYSGGMQRRLNIGLGLLHKPRLLILDEPTVGVDPQSRNAILNSIEQLSQAGIGVLYTTHYMEEAERFCDRIGIIDHGKLIAEGTRKELVSLVGEHDRVRLTGSGEFELAAQAVGDLPGVQQVHGKEDGLDLIVSNASALLPELLRRVAEAKMSLSSIDVRESNLESVFLHLTGHALRD